jgi:hypothetical protein
MTFKLTRAASRRKDCGNAMMVAVRALLAILAVVVASDAGAQSPQEMRLWPGKAPGSENWSVAETTTSSPSGDRTVANVSDPSVTVYLPPAASATGAAAVVAPGGALRLLAWDGEGVKVAQWLNSKGIAALVLKYRTLQTMPATGRGRGAGAPAGVAGAGRQELDIKKANANPAPDDAALTEVLHMATADAQQAIRLARKERGGLAHRPSAHRHHRILRRWRGGCRDSARREVRRLAGLPRLGLWTFTAGCGCSTACAAALHCRRLDALQRDQWMPGAIRRVEGRRETG